MVNKILKAIGVIGGVFVFSEVCCIIGECQALNGMHEVYPNEVDEFVDALCKADEILEDDTEVTKYEVMKAKLVGKLTKAVI